MTYVIDAKKRVEFENAIKQSEYSVVVEIVFDIVTDKSVVTACKCISHCDGKNFQIKLHGRIKIRRCSFMDTM